MITRYEDLPLGEYMKIDAILRGEGDELEKQVRIIALLSGNTEDEVLALPLDEYASRSAKAAFLAKPYQQSGEVKRTAKEFVIGGMTLIPTTDFTKITTAQYVDFQTFAKEFPATLPQVLGVMLVPKGKRYNEDYDMAAVVDAVKQLPMPVGMDLAAFFFARFAQSTTAMLTSLEKALPRTSNPAKREALKAKIRMAKTLLAHVGGGLRM